MRAEGPKERPTTHSSSSTICMCWTAKSAKAVPNMAQVKEVYITPALGSVVTHLLCILDAKSLEFCGLPYMVLLCLADQHINRSWTLLQAFGPHGLLMIYI